MEINNEPKRKCGFCGEDISTEVGRCPYCGSLLDIRIEPPASDIDLGQQAESVNNNMDNSLYIESNENTSTEYVDNGIDSKDDDKGSYEDMLSDDKVITNNNSYNNNQVNRVYENTNINKLDKNPLGNGLKVFLTIICTVIPGLGQLIGIITGIILMNSDDEKFGADKKSFGLALLVASLVMFVLSCIFCFIIAVAFSVPFQ